MKYFYQFTLLFVAVLDVGAEPVTSRAVTPRQASPEYRRAELRSILNESRRGQDMEREQRFENMAYDRRLSTQERADLRQQLRQQRFDDKEGRP